MLNKLFGGLVQYAACLLTTLPIMILLSLLGGIDPRLVLLTHAGTAAIAFFVGGLSILVSTSERRAGRALNLSVGLAMAWFILPAVLQDLLPRVSPLSWHWVRSYNAWFLASLSDQRGGSLDALWHRLEVHRFDRVDDRPAALFRLCVYLLVDRAAAAVCSPAGRGRGCPEQVLSRLDEASPAIIPAAPLR